MDLINILRSRVDKLDGDSDTHGLRAVLQHIQAAANHLSRGATSGDDTAFTDVIYRTNQAFEGSLKEAYRALAGKDPTKVRPYDIENYFVTESVLRPRVLEQLNTYRVDWRNPSTHDYNLDFDEDEALLAIVSVCAFAVVLIDQIVERKSYEKAQFSSASIVSAIDPSVPLVEVVAETLLSFRPHEVLGLAPGPIHEAELIGAVSGYLSRVVEGIDTRAEVKLSEAGREVADLLLSRGSDRVIMEVKRGRYAAAARHMSLAQLTHYVALSGVKNAVLFFYDEEGNQEMFRENYPLPGVEAKIVIIRPRPGKRAN